MITAVNGKLSSCRVNPTYQLILFKAHVVEQLGEGKIVGVAPGGSREALFGEVQKINIFCLTPLIMMPY